MLKYLLLISTHILFVNSANILLLSSVSSGSHSIWYGKLSFLLANRGHQVVVLDTDKNYFEHANITHIKMSGGYGWLKEIEEAFKADPSSFDLFSELPNTLEMIMGLGDPTGFQCDVILKSKETKQFMKTYEGKKFDLVIADNFCEVFFGFVHYFGSPPLINASPYYQVMLADHTGQFDNPSYVPFHFSSFSPEMSFVERLQNAFYQYFSDFIINNQYIPGTDEIIKEVFGPETPSLNEILKNNLALVMNGYSHVLQGAKPLPPNTVPIPAFQVEPPKPLPKNLQQFLDGAKDGAILFSMGSNFKSILMSDDKIEIFLSVFKNIPQKVIWKLELENATNIPSNVMITKWLPQSDILGHPKIKAFISHGGLLGIQEAVYHGVPLLGVPLMFDQVPNIKLLEEHGVAIKLNFQKLSTQYFSVKLHEILNNPSYYNKMKKLSAVFRDTPETSQERALFWIEYVLRNANNTKNYLRPSSVDMQWYQRLLLDVVGFLLVCLISLYYTIKFALKIAFSMLCRSKKKSNVNSTKKKQ